MLWSWFIKHNVKTHRPASRRPRTIRLHKPVLELLEDRLAPAGLNAVSVAGAAGISPADLTVVGTTLYYSTGVLHALQHGMITDLPGGYSNPAALTNVGDQWLAFLNSDGKLWEVDAHGPAPVPFASNQVTTLTPVGTQLYFLSPDATTLLAVYRAAPDGMGGFAVSGPVSPANVVGTDTYQLEGMAAAGSSAFFLAFHTHTDSSLKTTTSDELWVSANGAPAQMVETLSTSNFTGISPGPNGSLTAFTNTSTGLETQGFSANGMKLFDVTLPGVSIRNPHVALQTPAPLERVVGPYGFFVAIGKDASSNPDAELWQSSATGTTKEIASYPAGPEILGNFVFSPLSDLTDIGGSVYYFQNLPDAGNTIDSSQLFKILPGAGAPVALGVPFQTPISVVRATPVPGKLTDVMGQAFFVALNQAKGSTQQLVWTIDSSSGVPVPVGPSPFPYANPIDLASFEGSLYFVDTSGQLWIVAKSSSTTLLSSSLNPAPAGQSVTFTATVTGTGGTPTGTVTFVIDGNNTAPVALTPMGVASLLTSTLAGGPHTVVANYSGDSTFAASVSASLNEKITIIVKGASQTTLQSSANPSAYGQPVTFTAAVSGVLPGSGSPTGMVSFYDGATLLAIGPLSISNGVGTASFQTDGLSLANHSITAVYSGDDNLLGSTSPVVPQVVGTPNQRFVNQVYQDLTQSAPSPSDLTRFTNLLNNGTPRDQVISAIMNTQPVQIAEINLLYTTLVHHLPSQTELDAALKVLQGGGNLLDVEATVLSSPGYYTTQGNGTDTGFLSDLFQDTVGRGINSLESRLLGVLLSFGVPRAAVVTILLHNVEFYDHEVVSVYQKILHREPSPSEERTALRGLIRSAGDVTQLEVSLFSSPEYFNRASG